MKRYQPPPRGPVSNGWLSSFLLGCVLVTLVAIALQLAFAQIGFAPIGVRVLESPTPAPAATATFAPDRLR